MDASGGVIVQSGCPWVLCIDIRVGSRRHVFPDGKVFDVHRELVDLGTFESVSVAPPCAKFSIAVTPLVRNRDFPEGKPGVTKNIKQCWKQACSIAIYFDSLVPC